MCKITTMAIWDFDQKVTKGGSPGFDLYGA